jgi:hypothetical protein
MEFRNPLERQARIPLTFQDRSFILGKRGKSLKGFWKGQK